LRRVAVAASGGRDSTALLHCTQRAAAALGIEVMALHVHHGLMPQADAWLAQVRAQARRWGAGFASSRLNTAPVPGDSVEAWARRERYRVLAAMAQEAGCGLVLLAHHRRDQAETWLLQALRGGGPAGLASMPRLATRAGLVWARPWLDLPREAIESYVRRHRLRHVEDDSNADGRFARNRLRQQIWPALTAAFPDAEVALTTAAERAQEALALAREVAALDLPPLLIDTGLAVRHWRELPNERRRNALRAWVSQVCVGPVSEAFLARLGDELLKVRSARWPGPWGELQLHRGTLSLAGITMPAKLSAAVPDVVNLSRPGEYALTSWQGRFIVSSTEEGGVLAEFLRTLVPTARAGGERFSLSPRGLPRSLKKQYQALGIPAWERRGPLLFDSQGRLLFVPGLGLDARVWAPAGQRQLRLHWIADGPDQTGRRQSGG
jgi:tRNA(Ile)-lysidine synthase